MVRNHLVRHQMLAGEWPKYIVSNSPKMALKPGINHTENVTERNIGAFASGTEPTKMYAWWTMCVTST